MSVAPRAGAALAQVRLSVPPGPRVEFGVGALDVLPDALAGLGVRRAVVVTDPGVVAAGVLAPVLAALADGRVEVVAVLDGVRPNPSVADVEAMAAAARALRPDGVVAVGGGSSLDAAKGVALLAVGDRSAAELASSTEEALPGLPLVAVPTTAGTGAETNGFGVLEDPARRCKVYLGADSVRPRLSVLDPALTLGLPAGATAAAGVDALVHGLESLCSRGSDPFSQAAATSAVRLVAGALPSAVADGHDLEARAALLLGAHLAGVALSRSGLGLVHGVAHAVSLHAGATHGRALGSVLEKVLTFGLPRSAEALARAGAELGVPAPDPSAGSDPAATTRAAAATVAAAAALCDAVGVRQPLRELGVRQDQVAAVALTALADPVTARTPVTPTPAEVEALVLASW